METMVRRPPRNSSFDEPPQKAILQNPGVRSVTLIAQWVLFAVVLGNVQAAAATEVALAGVLGDKAVLVVDGGAPRALAVGGQTREGVRLLEVSKDSAVVAVDGKRERIALGGQPIRLAEDSDRASSLSLVADIRGHHFAQGSINGASVRFLLDTGASMISIGLADARRAGIDHRKGRKMLSQTASGAATAWLVRLDTVRVGELSLHGVDALVHENDLPFVLLGMSFLNRMDMERQGDRLILRKRY